MTMVNQRDNGPKPGASLPFGGEGIKTNPQCPWKVAFFGCRYDSLSLITLSGILAFGRYSLLVNSIDISKELRSIFRVRLLTSFFILSYFGFFLNFLSLHLPLRPT